MRKIKIWITILGIATIIMASITAYAYAYNNSIEKEKRFTIMFCLRKTNATENHILLSEPLDPWTIQAINQTNEEEIQNILVPWENRSDWILYPYWEEWIKYLPQKDRSPIFKYHDQYYKFDFPDIFWTPGLNIPLIPLGPIYGGWTGVSVAWVVTGLVYKKTKKDEEERNEQI